MSVQVEKQTRVGLEQTLRNERVPWASELVVAEAVGRLMEFWGFKRNMGRVWAMLYLSPRPLTARDIEETLGSSAGTVSTTLGELQRWGVVSRVFRRGERSRLFVAETDIWKMVRRVLRERERTEIEAAQQRFREALDYLSERETECDGENERVKLQRERIETLLELTRLAQRLLDALLTTARVDLAPLARFFRFSAPK